MSDLATGVRGLSPAGLNLYKTQLRQRVKTMQPQDLQSLFERIKGVPELSDIVGEWTGTVQPPQPAAQPTKELKPWEVSEEAPLWMKALHYGTLPFTMAQEYAVTPLVASLTQPFYMQQWSPEERRRIQREGVTSFMPGGTARESYEEWEDPEWELPWGWKIGAKEVAEALPWFAIPPIGAVGKTGTISGWLGRLGRGGRLIGKGLQYSPYGLLEAAPGAALKGVVKGVKGVVTKAILKSLPDLQDFGGAVNVITQPTRLRDLANMRGFKTISKWVGGKVATAQTPVEKSIVGRLALQFEGQQKSKVIMATLEALGTSQKAFQLDDLGRMTTGGLKGIHLSTIRSNPSKYMGSLSQAQKQWLQTSVDIEDLIEPFLKKYDIDINKLSFDEGGRWAGRRVVARELEGELLEYGFIGAGGGRPGAKLPFEKGRVFDNIDDALKEGFRYLPEEQALAMNVQGAYNRVADENMSKWLLEKIPYRTTAAPMELKIAAAEASKRLTKARDLQKAVNRALRGERLPEQTLRSLERVFPDIDLRNALGDANKLRLLRPQASGLIKSSQSAARMARSARAKARERLMRTGFGEARVPAPAFGGKILTGSEARESARLLREAFSPEFSKALGAINQVNSVGRYFALAGDASPFTIQLLFLAGAEPKIYAKSMGGFVKAFFDPEYHARFLANHADTIFKHRGLITTKGGATEMTRAMARGGYLRKGPLKYMGKVLEPFQRGYEAALDTAGIYMAEAYDYLGTSAQRLADVDSFINEFRGLASSARIGVSVGQRQVESAIILAPQYNRAVGALLTDLARGNLRGELARKAMAKGVAGIAAMTVVVSMALGEEPDKIVDHLNPVSPNFMTWDIAGQRVGPGSKVRSLLATFGKMVKSPKDAPYHASRFLRGNFSPVLGTSIDLITGKNYVGDPTRDGLLNLGKSVIAENMLPIWVQSVLLEGGDIPGRVTRGLSEFAGMRGYPMGAYGEMKALQDTLSKEKYGMEWSELTSPEGPGRVAQMRIEQGSPELQELSKKAAEESGGWARGETVVWNKYNEQKETIQNSVKQAMVIASREYEQTGDGTRFREKANEIYASQRMMFTNLKEAPEFGLIKEYFDAPPDPALATKMNPKDLAYREYMNMMYSDDMVDEFGNYKFEEAERRRQLFIRRYGMKALDYVEDIQGIKRIDDSPAMQALRRAREILKPYWDKEDEIWSQYPPEYKQIAYQIEILERTDPREARKLQYKYPQILVARRRIEIEKKRLKLRSPQIKEALNMFYRY